ncbi:PUA-like domain-containing protein [Gymnopilus junonius]|uniref:PUA-like domain-containing protein n=1 Tax=Gymnopilus junonius TaxID=109634 RepID=A0A9P5TU75_GYMJU|nr:PUA-like domain-containing protein [Gymnopilus junonius]
MISLQALRCPVCHGPLANPTTLHCGHSVCSLHLEAPAASCPVPACDSQPNPEPPRIPHDSPVRYNPAPSRAFPLTTHRSDVVLNNVLALVHRTPPLLPPPPHHDNDDDDDDDNSPRPRKRHKPRHDDNDLLAHLRSAASQARLVAPDRPLIPTSEDNTAPTDFDKKLLEELTCHICYVLFYQPVTTPCQHTFCAKCLQRSLDHSSVCPICRQELPSHYFQDQPVNRTLLAIILQSYPVLYQERRAAIDEEERHARLNTPIFVCNLSFPGMPTLLHFFEPRYRLMLRRCLESSNPRFGMVMSPKPGCPQPDYGTMLEIRSVQMLPDGRSMVETWGTTRFRILERGILDGYMVGRIERIHDVPDDLTESLVLDEPSPSPPTDRPLMSRIASSLTGASSSNTASTSSTEPQRGSSNTSESGNSTQPTNEELMETCKTFLDRLQRGAAPWVVQRLSSTYGAMPTDPALFSFWVALVLPIEEHEKAKLLPIRSPRLRLMLVVHWIEQLNNNWYAWLCCFVLAPIEGWLLEGPAPLLFPLLLFLLFCGNYFGCLPSST